MVPVAPYSYKVQTAYGTSILELTLLVQYAVRTRTSTRLLLVLVSSTNLVILSRGLPGWGSSALACFPWMHKRKKPENNGESSLLPGHRQRHYRIVVGAGKEERKQWGRLTERMKNSIRPGRRAGGGGGGGGGRG